jgi:hypothetical protein
MENIESSEPLRLRNINPMATAPKSFVNEDASLHDLGDSSNPVSQLIVDTPDLRLLVKRIKDSRESEFEKKVRLNDLYGVLAILVAPPTNSEDEDFEDSTERLLPYVQKYFDNTWLANPWITDSLVAQFLEIQYRWVAREIKESEQQGRRSRRSHMADIFTTIWLCVILMFGGYWGTAQRIWWVAPVSGALMLFLIYKLTQYAWQGTRDADQHIDAQQNLRNLARSLERTRTEVLSGYYDHPIVSARLLELEKQGLYIHSFVHRLLRVGADVR